MDDRKVIPLWDKTGVVPSPKMPASRVHSGQLLSMLGGIAAKFPGPTKSFQAASRDLIERTIITSKSLSCTFCKEREHFCVEILVDEDSNVFGYSVFVPMSWFGQLLKK